MHSSYKYTVLQNTTQQQQQTNKPNQTKPYKTKPNQTKQNFTHLFDTKAKTTVRDCVEMVKPVTSLASDNLSEQAWGV